MRTFSQAQAAAQRRMQANAGGGGGVSAAPVIAPRTPEARLVRAAALDVLLLNALADKPRTRSAVEAGAHLQALSEVAVHVLQVRGLVLPVEFRAVVIDAAREVGPCPEGRGAPEDWKSDREAWHAAVLDAVNARLAEVDGE